MRMRQGATKPDLTLTLPTGDGTPLLVADKVEVVGYQAGEEVFRREVPEYGLAGRRITHQWHTEDTATTGIITLVVEVTWDDGLEPFDIPETIEVVGSTSVGLLVSMQQLVNHMSGISLDYRQREDAEDVIAGVQRGLERALHRRFVETEATDTVYPDPVTGWVMLARTPVRRLLEVGGSPVPASEQTARITPAGVYLQGLTYPSYFAYGSANAVVIKYRGGGGMDPDDLDDVKLAILEKAAAIVATRHDDARTASNLETREAETPNTPMAWTNAELDTWGLQRLRRRVVA